MQLLNLRREFETLKMREDELVKDLPDRLLRVINQIRVLGEELLDKRVVEKVLVSLSERFEAKISSLEEPRDLGEITLSVLINASEATKQIRVFRQEEAAENALMETQKGKGAASSSKTQYARKERRKRVLRNKGRKRSLVLVFIASKF